ncbi:MAG: tape measure protein [Parabacteroides sp.]|nr:tape measure protein [Parabacteroides sp.]
MSGSTAQFADNLRYTTQLAQKYGVYVNNLTSNFTKFTAAASIAGMGMADQRKLFESLSRAAAGFGMSADDTNGMFLAITQMMGKGKIQAEELRGQLGECLPIAMQAMAKAAGTTVAGLDSIMKKGKLLSAEVLPKFADALNEMLPNVDTDNIETSLNRLKNAFQEFT